MYLHSLSGAVPQASFTQAECWELFSRSKSRRRLKTRSVDLIEKILLGDSGIDKRHFAVSEMESLFELPAEDLNRSFENEAPKLATRALKKALTDAGWEASSLDALVVCTCTGYICPGISSHVAEQLEIRPNAYLQDLVGLGCGAAIPSLRAAHSIVHSHEKKSTPRVAVVAVEICSAAFYLEDDPGVLISACIFSDGASASLWSNVPGPTRLQVGQFDTLHIPEDREFLRFLNSEGKLKNRLHRSIPARATSAVEKLWGNLHLNGDPSPEMVAHGGGRDVVSALSQRFPSQKLDTTQNILKRYGNMSSPSVLFSLEEKLKQYREPDTNTSERNYWLVSFGAGFSAHSCRLATTITPKDHG